MWVCVGLDEGVWEQLAKGCGTPVLGSSETLDCDLCLLSYGGDSCPEPSGRCGAQATRPSQI